jgi:hypothetical protein
VQITLNSRPVVPVPGSPSHGARIHRAATGATALTAWLEPYCRGSRALVQAVTFSALAQRQSTVTTSIGSERPLSVSVREADFGNASPTVAMLATISPPFATPAMRDASWTPLPR